MPAPDPFYDLRILTPSLEMRMCRSDDDFRRVADGVSKQIHDPDAEPPFANNWTSKPPDVRAEKTVELLKGHQDSITSDHWNVELSVFDTSNNEVVGGFSLRAEQFSVLRLVEIGLWVGFEHQGRGVGRVIVAGAIELVVSRWGALDVVYTALQHNSRSLNLAERLGFETNGHTYLVQDGQRKRLEQRILESARWTTLKTDGDSAVHRALRDITIISEQECLPFLARTG